MQQRCLHLRVSGVARNLFLFGVGAGLLYWELYELWSDGKCIMYMYIIGSATFFGQGRHFSPLGPYPWLHQCTQYTILLSTC